jgi:hypothetical protein
VNPKLKRWIWVGLASLALIAVIASVLIATIDVEPFVSSIGDGRAGHGRADRRQPARAAAIVTLRRTSHSATRSRNPTCVSSARGVRLMPLLQRRIEIAGLLVEPHCCWSPTRRTGNWSCNRRSPRVRVTASRIRHRRPSQENAHVTFREGPPPPNLQLSEW